MGGAPAGAGQIQVLLTLGFGELRFAQQDGKRRAGHTWWMLVAGKKGPAKAWLIALPLAQPAPPGTPRERERRERGNGKKVTGKGPNRRERLGIGHPDRSVARHELDQPSPGAQNKWTEMST